jgi:hypothetical protein
MHIQTITGALPLRLKIARTGLHDGFFTTSSDIGMEGIGIQPEVETEDIHTTVTRNVTGMLMMPKQMMTSTTHRINQDLQHMVGRYNHVPTICS